MANPDMKGIHDGKGAFKRPDSGFRSWLSADPNAEFPAEADRYVLYIILGCPWAHRANIVRSLKHLEPFIQLVVASGDRTEERGWLFNGAHGTAPVDPLYGLTDFASLYHKAKPDYDGRFTVPVIWDKKKEAIVSNESADIIRMLATAFDHLLPEQYREEYKEAHGGGLRPKHLIEEIDALNEWVYSDINNGVYRAGFAKSQEAYDEAIQKLFAGLDRVEDHLAAKGTKYLMGDHITEADVRLYTTIIRFDAAYVTIFACNLKQIRYDYPKLHDWLRRLYWEDNDETYGAFKTTTYFDVIKEGYVRAAKGGSIVPKGPALNILPWKRERDEQEVNASSAKRVVV